MNPVTLEEMRNITLMDRLDYKYVAPISFLPDLLEGIMPFFKVQVNNGVGMAPYATQYLDTPALDMYRMHQNGKLNRQKVRIRTYIDSCISFLEVKSKNNKGRTSKVRIPVDYSHITSAEELKEGLSFLEENTPFVPTSLQPVLSNEFRRITLVNNRKTERVTIDFDISFQNYETGETILLDDLIVLELKQDDWQHSNFRDILSRMRIKDFSFSKYSLGTFLTNPAVKGNRFKFQLRQLNKYTQNIQKTYEPTGN